MNRTSKRLLLWVGGVALLTPTIYFLSVPLWGPLWQIMWGNSLQFAEWTVPIPSRYYVRGFRESRTFLWKTELGRPLWQAPYAMFGFFQANDPFHYAEDYDTFALGASTEAERQGYKLHSARSVGSRIYCLEFQAERGLDLKAECAIEGSKVFVSFEGHRKYVSDFHWMLQNMAESKAAKAKTTESRFTTSPTRRTA